MANPIRIKFTYHPNEKTVELYTPYNVQFKREIKEIVPSSSFNFTSSTRFFDVKELPVVDRLVDKYFRNFEKEYIGFSLGIPELLNSNGKNQTEEITEQEKFDNEWLRAEDVAKMLNVSTSKVYTMVDKGQFAVLKIDRTIRIHRDSVKKFIDDNTLISSF